MAENNETSSTDSNRNDIYSNAVRAGKRTYFFDVKATRANDLYLTITESKKHFHEDGKFSFQKHKLFLYKEDFDKFTDGFDDALFKIRELQEANNEYQNGHSEDDYPDNEISPNSYTDVDFDDLNRD